ncbi:CDC45-like protein [Fomitiporia mediterranea MF3/22]|uniref:CDC45-like protein n=1 Tax=Fomitiporia mediterranea (strain MF3/22) TaxID=694068 RepID=UPI0004407817|nr:CDC45-like protein [Fomitiporia mediterranea MF3/22]EJD02326.1 CDC45-like protein [Fomitiporia mediterranea MF3/22]
MVYLPPPQYESPSKRGYEQAYHDILATHRSSPRSSASSLIMLVAPDVDALCAARMLTDLFKQDDIMHRIIPVSGIDELMRIRDEMVSNVELRTLILINMGAIFDLPTEEWFGEFPQHLRVHVIDSNRPQNLASLFGPDEKIVIWDDGDAEALVEQKKAWEALAYAPDDSDDDSDDDDSDSEEEEGKDEDEDEGLGGSSSSGKRRRSSPGTKRKRRRLEDDPNRLSPEDREHYTAVIEKYYMSGTYYGQAASSTVYVLANVLARADNDLLWFAILGVTFQYATSRISREKYDQYYALYANEVKRLNKDVREDRRHYASNSARGPDDNSIRIVEELRFMLWRHWNLYDAMMHSGYVASKLNIWREKGRKRLHGLLAKMGFSTVQSQQPYSHMDMSLKKDLHSKLEAISPEYGMVELSYSSFTRCCGYRVAPLSAADSVEAVSALLDAAGGVRLEVEIEGARNGGEWFGGGHVWQLHGQQQARWRDDERENIPPGGQLPLQKPNTEESDEEKGKKRLEWWVRNFWTAFDSLNDITQLRDALRLSMGLHRAVIRTGSALIDARAIRTMRGHRVALLTQGPDLALFCSPGPLARLARWLVDAMRERVKGMHAAFSQSKKKSLPFVVAALNEREQTYLVVGVNAALEMGDVRKNEFGLAFLDAKERCNARTRHSTFDTNILEIKKEDLELFLQTLCEGAR